MPLTIVAPARLPEALAEPAAEPLSLPNLEALLASSTIAAGASAEHAVCELLGIETDADGVRDPPIAPLRLAGEAVDASLAREGYWLCADPVATTLGLDSIRVDAAVDDLTDDEASALILALNEFFAVDGLRFVATTPSHWHVRAASTQNVVTSSLDHVIGRSMLRWMPNGADGPAWRARINEIQMLLHAHPVNAAREQRRRRLVTSCWIWGGGSWPTSKLGNVDVVVDPPPWVAAICRENGIGTTASADAPSLPAAASLPDADRRALLFVDPPPASSAAAQWRTLDQGLFAKLVAARSTRTDPFTLIVPWTDGALRIDVGLAKRRTLLQRLLGGRDAPPPSLEQALGEWLRR